MKLRKLTALGLAVIMTLAVAACGKTETKTSEKESTPAKESTVASESKTSESTPAASESKVEEKTDWSDTTIRVAWWGGDARNNQTIAMLDDFAAKYYPGLNIEVEYAGFGDYFTKLTTQASAKTMPDVYMMNDTRLREFVAGGVMADLYPFIESGIIDDTNISEAALGAGVVDGGLYAVNTGSNTLAMFYDPAEVEAAGKTLSYEPTWAELMDVAEAVYANSGKKVGITFWMGSNQVFDAWLRSQGKSVFAEDMKSYGFEAADYVEYLEMAIDLIDKEYFMDANLWEGEHFAEMADDSGLWLSLSGEWSNVMGSFESMSGKSVAVATAPIANDATGHGAYLHPCMLWAVNAYSDPAMQEIGAAFINYFANEQYPYEQAGLDRGVPINTEVAAWYAGQAPDVDARGIEFLNTLVEEGKAGANPAYPNAYNEAHVPLSNLAEQVHFGQVGKADLLAAVEAAMAEGNAILAANN